MNLVTNQHGIFTYRKSINKTSLRISLQTKDNLEALRIVDRLNSIVEFSASNDPEQVKRIIYAVVQKMQPTFKKERLGRLQSMLGVELEPDNGEQLSKVVQLFVEEKLRSRAWTEKTFVTYKVIFESLPLYISDKGVKTVTHKDAQYVKKILQQLPSSMNKRAKYKGKSVQQILKMNIPESHLMSIKTINTRLGCYSELFKWCIRNGYADINVFDGLALKDSRNIRQLRLPFTPKDLKAIFNSHAINNPKHTWQRWLPLLGLYTGARLNELCQLQLKDVRQERGIWLIDINEDGENQYLKSSSSKRIIPLHNELIGRGFIDFVQSIKGGSNMMLFSELELRNERYSHTPSKWFGRIKSEVLSDSDKKSFHSFRHTFIDFMFNSLKLQGNPLLKALVGHTDREVTSGVYGSSFELEDLNSVVQRIKFFNAKSCL